MVLPANVDWIGTFCTALAITCAFQLILTGALALIIPHVLSLTNTQYATGAGLLAGFVALPAAIRFKSVQESPNMDRIYGYTMCYQKLVITLSAFLHCSAVILTLYTLITTASLDHGVMQLMKDYQTRKSSKILVDNIQWALQCCGVFTYKDWFSIDWEGYRSDSMESHRKQSIAELLSEDTEVYPDVYTTRRDTVPFSCCAVSVSSPCFHKDLFRLGASTINSCGCAPKILKTSHIILWVECSTYSLCLLLEITIFGCIHKHTRNSTDSSAMPLHTYKQCEYRKLWGTFSNEKVDSVKRYSSAAEINPSSHSEIKFKTLWENR